MIQGDHPLNEQAGTPYAVIAWAGTRWLSYSAWVLRARPPGPMQTKAEFRLEPVLDRIQVHLL